MQLKIGHYHQFSKPLGQSVFLYKRKSIIGIDRPPKPAYIYPYITLFADWFDQYLK
jgi:hypothetical protein